MKKFRTLYTVS